MYCPISNNLTYGFLVAPIIGEHHRRAASIGRQIIYPNARLVEPLPEQRPTSWHQVGLIGV